MRSFFVILILCLVCSSCVWNGNDEDLEYLPLDDSEYPYAGLPRLVIETDHFAQIIDRETELPAHLQIYGKSGPETEILDLTVKGRGHSSFEMSKYGIKLEFKEKTKLFEMPSNRDWVLVSNQIDKTMLRNYITYQLAWILEDEYAPRCTFVEVFLNRKYIGLYLLAEHMKVGKNRINIIQDSTSFFIEKTKSPDPDDLYFESSMENVFKVRYPKNASVNVISSIKNDVDHLEKQLSIPNTDLNQYIDLQDFVRYYAIQEFSKNVDGAFDRSIYITKEANDVFKMGPVWDFDVAYGLFNGSKTSPSDWYARKQGWYKHLVRNPQFSKAYTEYWRDHKNQFLALKDSIDVTWPKIHKAVINDEKRWPILNNNQDWPFVDSYPNYEAAIDSLKIWISNRAEWISSHL
ncbi:CotH kinase family protein [Fibrobacter sp. UWEL]|uniref:CotH kinase family protein n=1 Tax=Fibrobacter sp. UWEL TaxID=1896209 RepID=UPI00091AA5D0|nr:CotH kinase family protein [Fibrobacter sp. UWEL]SHK91695.1 CotH protein [Fibrobacter sp. UWEL]